MRIQPPDPRHVGMIVALMVLVVVLSALHGCAEKRFLTKEQDDEMRERCEEKGCAVIPSDLMQAILKRLQGTAI